ncbi:Translation machinery-associated protein 20 [Penicillium daleae]|uniref:Translation machinery-associated protein 20 n=1 Tax=Penicillium daleae TaxID=63821 RepID=A0AAD6BVE1_9EURO|nr:Translation machinery-associated protein 20 [Penicillium daleae]KAJ5432625.1 Translation machinery-associated protein 20 [Penicillium daleae]
MSCSIPPSNRSKVKSSAARALRQKLLETYPGFEPYIEEIMPKKASLEAVKLYALLPLPSTSNPHPRLPSTPQNYVQRCHPPAPTPQEHKLNPQNKDKPETNTPSNTPSPERATLYTIDSTPLFFQRFDDPPIPHLRLLHAYPTALPTIQIDRGAIRFVLSGATLMAPGLTSPGGRLPDAEHALEAGQVVAIKAEGKEEICLVGALKVGTEEMKSKGKGVVMDEGHYLGDGLWTLQLD